jgi:hypothetical protein
MRFSHVINVAVKVPFSYKCYRSAQLSCLFSIQIPSNMKLSPVIESNAYFEPNPDAPVVAGFAGATSGIGASTLDRMARMCGEATFYVLGRSEKRFAERRTQLESFNPRCKIIFLEAEFSLLSHVDAASKKILDCESKLHYVFMSTGMIPLNSPKSEESSFQA